jgi:hypothetical protein
MRTDCALAREASSSMRQSFVEDALKEEFKDCMR